MRIFISYQTLDAAIAKAVAGEIKAHRPNVDLFFAPETLSAGAYWLPRLAQEIKNSHAVLLLIGKRIGKWQELEYLEAVRVARDTSKPLIVPVVMGDYAPGLPFFNQFHRLFFREPASNEAVAAILKALDGAFVNEGTPLWAQFNPYRGLAAFGSADSAFFFGRETLTAAILTLLQDEQDKALVLIGNSGVGKSSLAQAGVIAALKQQAWPGGGAWPAALADSRSWLPLTIRPEQKPLKSLALTFMRLIHEHSSDQDADAEGWVRRFREGAGFGDLLRAVKDGVVRKLASDAPQSFLLYIDQGEELYASAVHEGKPDTTAKRDARAFSRVIAEAARRANCRVLFSLRSDYYGSLQDDEALFAITRRVDVPPMRVDALRQAIERPAAMLGVRFEPVQMPGYLAGATAREAGALPLLAYLLSDMWRDMHAREDGLMRFSERPEIFDVSAALRERAERYRAQNKRREGDLKRLFTLRLAQMPRLGDVIKRRARRAECSTAEWAIAEELATEDWRLVTLEGGSGEVTAEVAHEQILRKWPALEGWLKELRDFLLWKAELEVAREAYDETPAGEKTQALLSGRRLLIARNWLASYGEDLAAEDRAFVQASIKSDDDLRKRERRLERKILFRTLVGAGSAIFFTLAAIAAFIAFLSWQRSERSYEITLTTLDYLIKDLAGEMRNAEGMPVSTIERILKNGQVLAEDLKKKGQGDRRLDASRAAMLFEFGRTYQMIGQREEAIRASNEGLAIRRQLAKADPDNEIGAVALSLSLDLAGDLERENKAYDRARSLYEESVAIETPLNARNPANADFAINLSKTIIRLGDLDRFDKNYQQAKSHYGDAFQKIKGVLRNTVGEPSKPLQRELTWNYNKRGDADVDLKNYAEAKPSYEAALCLRKHLLLSEPDNRQLKHDISWSYDKIAVVKLQLLDFEGALEAQFSSLSIRRALVESQTKQVIWRRDMAAALHQIGEIKSKAGDFTSALMFFIAAAEVRLALKKEAPSDTAARAAFESSMTRAKDIRVAILERQIEWMEQPYREVVQEEELSAAARAKAGDNNGDACWKGTIAKSIGEP